MYGAYLLVDAVSNDGQREQHRRWSLQAARAVRPLQGGPLVVGSRVVVVLTLAAIVTGTVVTGTGPHAGDESAPRFDYLITSVVRVHGTAVWLAVLASLWLGWQLWRTSADQRVQRSFEWFLFLAILQGGLGYLQYFTGVPVPLVALHVALSVVVWLAALRLATIARRDRSCDTMA
jgi:cytochrome c oxidase assembly protein subunit 15